MTVIHLQLAPSHCRKIVGKKLAPKINAVVTPALFATPTGTNIDGSRNGPMKAPCLSNESDEHSHRRAGSDALCATVLDGGVGRTGGNALCAGRARGAGGDALCATLYVGGCVLLLEVPEVNALCAGRARGAGGDALCATLLDGGVGGAGRAGGNALSAILYAGGAGGDALCVTLLDGGVGHAGRAGRAGGNALSATLYAGGDGVTGGYALCATLLDGGIGRARGNALCAIPYAGRAGGALKVCEDMRRHRALKERWGRAEGMRRH